MKKGKTNVGYANDIDSDDTECFQVTLVNIKRYNGWYW